MSIDPKLSPSESRLPDVSVDLDSIESGTSLWQDAWHRLRKNHMALISFWILVFMAVFCFVGPFLSPYDHRDNDLEQTLMSPHLQHPF